MRGQMEDPIGLSRGYGPTDGIGVVKGGDVQPNIAPHLLNPPRIVAGSDQKMDLMAVVQ